MSSSGDATTSSRGQLSSRSPTRIMGPVQQVRLAYQVGNRFFTLSSDIDATSGGDTVAREVYYRWKEEAAAGTLWYRLQSLLWKPVLQIGAVSTLLHDDVEDANILREVFFSTRDTSPELTAAFHRPELLLDVDSFAESYPSVITGYMPTKMVVVTLMLGKAALFSGIVFALLVSIAISLVTGLATSSRDAGFACFEGLALIISLLFGVIYHRIQ